MMITKRMNRAAGATMIAVLLLGLGAGIRRLPATPIANATVDRVNPQGGGPALRIQSGGGIFDARPKLLLAKSAVGSGTTEADSKGLFGDPNQLERMLFSRSRLWTNDFAYTGGIVSNKELPASAGQLILNVYLEVDKDGTGRGTLSDVLNKDINSHLAIRRSMRQGNGFLFEGEIVAANTEARVGRPFVAAGVVSERFTSLEIVLDEGTFTGKGFFVSAPRLVDPFSR